MDEEMLIPQAPNRDRVGAVEVWLWRQGFIVPEVGRGRGSFNEVKYPHRVVVRLHLRVLPIPCQTRVTSQV